MTRSITLRPLRGRDEFERCVALQRETWGDDFVELVPAGLLKIIERNGGLVAGAFDDGRLLGFVLGLAGFRDGERIQWSHMLAVAPAARGRGIGRALKLMQREISLERGVHRIYWTFDPLQARNAHLNVNRLGVDIAEYVPDMYGTDTKSLLHPGEFTDRFVAEWRLDSERVRMAVAGEPVGPPVQGTLAAPLVGPEAASAGDPGGGAPDDDAGEAGEDELPDPGAVRIRIPCDFLALDRRDPGRARRWRLATRRAFPFYLERGYAVRGVYRTVAEGAEPGAPDGSLCFYYLERRPAE